MTKLLPKTERLIQQMRELEVITDFHSVRCTNWFEKAQTNFPDRQDLIWEIILASDRCYMEDAESGRYLPDYEMLLKGILDRLFSTLSDYIDIMNAFKYDLRAAQAEDLEIKSSIQSFKNLINKKHED